MPLKILHTSDIHLGMKFASYDGEVQEKLVEARFECLARLVSAANEPNEHVESVEPGAMVRATPVWASTNWTVVRPGGGRRMAIRDARRIGQRRA